MKLGFVVLAVCLMTTGTLLLAPGASAGCSDGAIYVHCDSCVVGAGPDSVVATRCYLSAGDAHATLSPATTCTPYTGGPLGNVECVYFGSWTGVTVGQGIVVTGVDVRVGIGSDGIPDLCVSTHQECLGAP